MKQLDVKEAVDDLSKYLKSQYPDITNAEVEKAIKLNKKVWADPSSENLDAVGEYNEILIDKYKQETK